jgi:membrane protease subunit (stomatin/prohibitin family)
MSRVVIYGPQESRSVKPIKVGGSSVKLTANRVVLILHSVIIVLTIAGFYVAAVTHSLPASWQKVAGLVAGVIAALVAGTSMALKFLDGSQKSEQLQANAAKTAPQEVDKPPQAAGAATSAQLDALVEQKVQSAVQSLLASLGQSATTPAPVATPAEPVVPA